MMLKIGSEYLDFVGRVEMQRKVKLFEDIDTADGDVSFGFVIQDTNHNRKLLNFPLPDNYTKSVYQRIPCEMQDDNGVTTHDGFLRIERILKGAYYTSFFSGNSNWFSLISGNLTDLDFSQYDTPHEEDEIVAAWTNTDGIAFPLIDNGGLLTRSMPHLKVEDFVAGFYTHTIIKKIFQASQIKLEGELFQEPLYQKLITLRTSKDNTLIDARSCFVEKNVNQAIADNTPTKVTWDNDSTDPYFDGTNNNFDLANSQYVADLKQTVNVQCTLVYLGTGFLIVMFINIRLNGVTVRSVSGQAFEDVESSISVNASVQMEAGDILDVEFVEVDADGEAGNLVRGTLRVTPTYIYRAIGNSIVPRWTKQQYVSNIFQLFNVITHYEPKTRTLTCNLFNKLKDKTPIDISSYVKINEIDYESFISNYGKQTTLEYNELDFDEVKEYNIANFFRYGVGVIRVNNEFLSEEENIVSLEFSNPFSYINTVFDMSMERTNLILIEEGEEVDFSDVGDDGSGNAAFNIDNEIFIVNDLVRIKESTNDLYNGDYIVSAIPSGHVVLNGVPFDTAATGKVVKLNFIQNTDDDVFLLVNIPTYSLSNFSGQASLLFENTEHTQMATGYFSLLNTGRQINTDYKQSLSFGDIADPLFYQRTMIETYWSLVERILNDPVKPIGEVVMPSTIYRNLTFLQPVIIRTLETSTLYYLNKITGYQNSYQAAEIELIKLP